MPHAIERYSSPFSSSSSSVTSQTNFPEDRRIPLYVARYYNDASRFQHWSLFLDGPMQDMKVQHQIYPNEWSGKFNYELSGHPNEETMDLLDLTFISYVSSEDFDMIARMAESVATNSTFRFGWQVQSYVMNLITYLCRFDVIDVHTMSEEEETQFERNRSWLNAEMETE